jgi:glucose/arabinose dehydrogenase
MRTANGCCLTIRQPYSNHNGGQLAFRSGRLPLHRHRGRRIRRRPAESRTEPSRRCSATSSASTSINATGDTSVRHTAGQSHSPGTPKAGPRKFSPGACAIPGASAFDTGHRQTIWNADVGQNRFEEINIIESGKNYGWRIMEGFACYDPLDRLRSDRVDPPRLRIRTRSGAVHHRRTRLSRLPPYPEIEGKYVYADFVSGRKSGR